MLLTGSASIDSALPCIASYSSACIRMWSKQEDEIVRKAVMKYGTNQWNRVASLLRRHTAAECRQRWRDVLNPRLNISQWTPEEDAKLRTLALQMPNMWRSIGTSLGRSGDVVYARFLELTQGKLDVAEEITDKTDDEDDPEESDEEDMSELIAANARLSSSMGRKAQRKKRERLESEQKFEDAVREHRETGKRLKETTFNRPTIEVPNAVGRFEQPAPYSLKPLNSTRKRSGQSHRPKLVLPPPIIEKPVLKPAMAPQEVQKLLSQLPPPKNRKASPQVEPFLSI